MRLLHKRFAFILATYHVQCAFFFYFYFLLVQCAHSQIPKRKTQGENAILLVDKMHKLKILTHSRSDSHNRIKTQQTSSKTTENREDEEKRELTTINPRFLSQLLH